MGIRNKIKNFALSNRALGYIYINNKLKYLINKQIWGGKRFSDDLDSQFNIFLNDKERNDKAFIKFLTLDIIWSYLRFGSTPQEYFLMDFRKLSPKERSKFLTNKHKDETMIKAVGMDDNWDLLEDKIIFYQYFHHFFHREVFIPGKGKEKDFDNFCARHNCLIVKKKDGQCGKGVYKINSSELSESHKCELATCDDNIIEEVIRQSGKMASLNESSVNTVRIPSFSTKGNYSILKPFLRMGRSGSIVDNGNSGGIFATIDPKTGIINGHGHDLRGNEYISHPDSGVVLKGWQIPDWDDLLKLTKDVHQIIPFYPYVGWDFAHTDKGWCLIEGNWGQFLSEFADKEGIKSKFDSYFQNI